MLHTCYPQPQYLKWCQVEVLLNRGNHRQDAPHQLRTQTTRKGFARPVYSICCGRCIWHELRVIPFPGKKRNFVGNMWSPTLVCCFYLDGKHWFVSGETDVVSSALERWEKRWPFRSAVEMFIHYLWALFKLNDRKQKQLKNTRNIFTYSAVKSTDN